MVVTVRRLKRESLTEKQREERSAWGRKREREGIFRGGERSRRKKEA